MPLAVKADSHRRLEERLRLRVPRVFALWGRAVLRLPPRSRLRQTLLRRSMRLALEAYNRKDLDAAYMTYHPDSETIFPQQLVAVGFDLVTRGREARLSAQGRWHAEWGEFRFAPDEGIDLGDGRFLVVGRIKGSGLSSGAGVDNDWALLVTTSAGQVTREQVFFDRSEAFGAAGLSE
jgi:ketosteroid isomerase-like protein